jgi:hypothetical protein
MSRKKNLIWTDAGDSDEDIEKTLKGFYKCDYFVNRKVEMNNTEEDEQVSEIIDKKIELLGKKHHREEYLDNTEDYIGPRVEDNENNNNAKPNDDVKRYEQLGYVMSGARFNKPAVGNNIPVPKNKKEAHIFSAEEKRALAIFNLEEQQRKENNIINDLKSMWQNKKEEK